jgi:hypothetical protein
MMAANLISDPKWSLVLIAVIAGTIIFDSSVVPLSTFIDLGLRAQERVLIFIVLFFTFCACSFWILKAIRDGRLIQSSFGHKTFEFFYKGILTVALSIGGIFLLIIFQVLMDKSYATLYLYVGAYLTHFSAIFFLGATVFMLVKWLISSRNRILVLYAISFTMLSVDMLISMGYLTVQFSNLGSHIRVHSIQWFLVMIPGAELSKSFGPILDILSLISFVLAWFATALLMMHYRQRMGRLKYWILIAMPLAYFIFPFEPYLSGAMQSLTDYSLVISGVTSVLLFSATQQVGGILFATVFLTASATVKRTKLRNSLIMTSIGMAVLFGSVEIDSLLYAVYPPFGFVTISYLPLGSFLLFTGLFISARFVSQDAELRKELYRNAKSQLRLLKSIGVAQMEKDLEQKAKVMTEKLGPMQYESPEVEEEEMKQILRDVLAEIHYTGKQDR